MAINAPDLTKRPPRSPRVRLGGYVILPRLLDKGRATLARKNGEYIYDCPLDQRFLKFAGINSAALKKQLAAGKGDGDILKWINQTSRTKPLPWEINAWSAYQEQSVPSVLDTREFFQKLHKQAGPKRDDVATWFDLLDLDDHVTFGGKA